VTGTAGTSASSFGPEPTGSERLRFPGYAAISAGSDDAAIEAVGITKSLGHGGPRVARAHKVRPGEFVTLVGDNGAGNVGSDSGGADSR
jgi:hypothetical protein